MKHYHILKELLAPMFDPDEKEAAKETGRLLSDGGLNASPGAGVGYIVFDKDRAVEISNQIKSMA